jgi:hypothetical protein
MARLIQLGKWGFLGLGLLGVCFAFAAWFVVPGVVDQNRLIVAVLFASLAINAFLLSGILSYASTVDRYQTFASIFRTVPVVVAGVFLLLFALVSATARWWGRR